MTAAVRPGDVLRGMHLESQAVAVGRARVDIEPSPSTATPLPQRDLLQERVDAALQRLREAAEQSGYEAGLRAGQDSAARQAELDRKQASAKAQAELQEERDAVRALAANLACCAPELLARAEDDMVAMCFEVLCRVLGESALTEDAVRMQVRMAARHLPSAGDIVIHVHPADAQLLTEGATAGTPRLQWVADPDVALGGCVVEHAAGGIDLRFETALAACRESLAGERERRLGGGRRP